MSPLLTSVSRNLLTLSETEVSKFKSYKQYLELSKHKTLQKRHYKKSGQFDFYDLSCLENPGETNSVISIFHGGPKARDLYFTLMEVRENLLQVKVLKSGYPPELLDSKITETLNASMDTAVERLPNLLTGASFKPRIPYGYSLWSRKPGKGSEENFLQAVNDFTFSKDMMIYCGSRNFCLYYKPKAEEVN